MYGKPLVCSEIGTGTTFINQHGITGLVVPPNDPDALHQALCRLWNNPEYATAMGQQAQGRYKTFFTAECMVNAYVELYKKYNDGVT
jgi:rhamnosyl/mannosyltransferase